MACHLARIGGNWGGTVGKRLAQGLAEAERLDAWFLFNPANTEVGSHGCPEFQSIFVSEKINILILKVTFLNASAVYT